MKLKGEVKKIDEEKFLVFGWASMADVVDAQGDTISIGELEKAAYNYVLKSRAGGAMHEVIGVADLVESMVFTPEKLEVLGLKEKALPPGWFVGFKVNDTDAWQKIKRGDYKMFSIGGRALREAKADE